MRKDKKNLQQHNKLIELLNRIDLPNGLAAIGGGIAALATVIYFYALSQEPSPFLNVDPYAYQLSNATQSPSEAKTNPSISATPSTRSKTSSAPVANNYSRTTSNRKLVPDRLTVADGSRTISIPSVPTGVTTPEEAAPNSVTVPNPVLTIPTTLPVPNRALTTPDPRFKPDSFTVANSFSSRLDEITRESNTSTTPNTATLPGSSRISQRLLTTPSSKTTLSRVWLASGSTTTFSKLPPSSRSAKRTSIAINSFLTQRSKYVEPAIADANAVAFGLVVAKREGQISPYTTTWRKAQDAIFLLRQRKTRQEAARGSGVPLPVLMQLIAWGQNRP